MYYDSGRAQPQPCRCKALVKARYALRHAYLRDPKTTWLMHYVATHVCVCVRWDEDDDNNGQRKARRREKERERGVANALGKEVSRPV